MSKRFQMDPKSNLQSLSIRVESRQIWMITLFYDGNSHSFPGRNTSPKPPFRSHRAPCPYVYIKRKSQESETK